MIIKFKIFEKVDNEPKIGDYVICSELESYKDIGIEYFLSENIGKCINIIYNNNFGEGSDKKYIIEYYNIPYKIKNYFKFDKVTGVPYGSGSSIVTNCRIMSRQEVIHSSEDKDYLKIILISKKYNL